MLEVFHVRNTKPALKRIIGGGFALATAAAFVVPGVALADTPDEGSLSSLQDILPGTGSTDDTNAVADEGDSMFGSITDIFGCFSTDDGEEGDDSDDASGIGSVTTVIDCVMDAIGGGDEGGETPTE